LQFFLDSEFELHVISSQNGMMSQGGYEERGKNFLLIQITTFLSISGIGKFF